MSEQRNVDDATAGCPGVGRVLVVIPTYNEIDNIGAIVTRVRHAVPRAEVLIAHSVPPVVNEAVSTTMLADHPCGALLSG